MFGVAAIAHGFQRDLLADIGRAKVVIALLMKDGLQQRARHGGVAEFQSRGEGLAEGVGEDGELVSFVKRFDRGKRISVIAQLAISRVLKDKDAVVAAELFDDFEHALAARQREGQSGWIVK